MTALWGLDKGIPRALSLAVFKATLQEFRYRFARRVLARAGTGLLFSE